MLLSTVQFPFTSSRWVRLEVQFLSSLGSVSWEQHERKEDLRGKKPEEMKNPSVQLADSKEENFGGNTVTVVQLILF